MIAKAYKTRKIVVGDSLEKILDLSLPKLPEKSVVIITSKIVGICEGRVVKNDGKISKEMLVRREAERLLVNEAFYAKHATFLTITNHIFVPSAGIDESNGNGYFILWPKNPVATATKIWKYLRKKNHIQNLGIVIVDSTFMPLRLGSVGVGLGWCGFLPIINDIGRPDVFGVPLKYTREGVLDTLASIATLLMGEADQQLPLVVVKDIPGIIFVTRPPSKQEKQEIKNTPVDMFNPMINAALWENGEAGSTEEL